MSETDLRTRVENWAEDEGGGAKKLVLYSERGWPDLTIFLPGGRIIIPELKLPTKHKKYEQQRIHIKWLQSLGFASDFCMSLEQVQELAANGRLK